MANRKISDLTALTTPATGDLLAIVDISEAAAADKNKKITIGELFASIPLGTAAAPSVAFEGDPNTGIYSPGADQVAISTNGTDKLIVKSDGNIWIGNTGDLTSSANRLSIEGSRCIDAKGTGGATNPLATFWNNATTGDNVFLSLRTETSDTIRGSITYNRAGGVVAYNITSDYRSKTISGNLEDAGTIIDAFKVYRGVMNGATIERPMLIAHEAQEVAPYCVTGEKDAEDDDGNPIYQQMDHQVLVPLLIAEIQQLRIRVAALEAA